METNVKIKKITRKIYNIDYSKITLRDDDEFILQSNGVSEFTQMLKKFDTDNGIIVTPSGYRTGLFYSIHDDGELYASSKLLPDMVTFSFNIYGLKKGNFYRITILGRDTDNNTIITEDRTVTVIDDARQIILSSDLKGFDVNQECVGFFKSFSNEVNLYFTLGKVVIKDIIIDEVQLFEEEQEPTEEEISEEMGEGKETLAAYGIYSLVGIIPEGFKGRYIQLSRFSGKGLDLFYDQYNHSYILERSNSETILNDPFTNLNYKIDINTSKVVNDNVYDCMSIVKISPDISANTLKQGYLEFAFTKGGERILYPDNSSRIYISIYKYQ